MGVKTLYPKQLQVLVSWKKKRDDYQEDQYPKLIYYFTLEIDACGPNLERIKVGFNDDNFFPIHCL